MPPVLELVGVVFGYLTVLGRVGTHSDGSSLWSCRCVCGMTVDVAASLLRKRKKTSCGCKKRERMSAMAKRMNTKHCHAARDFQSPEYRTWKSMRRRCDYWKHIGYQDYGLRGIRVCERWNNFMLFYLDMGKKPSPSHSIDRIDNDKGYAPENCRWATPVEQAANRRSRRPNRIDVGGP
jgi:hypothetical protein